MKTPLISKVILCLVDGKKCFQPSDIAAWCSSGHSFLIMTATNIFRDNYNDVGVVSCTYHRWFRPDSKRRRSVSCLFLAGACRGFCSSDLIRTRCLLSPAAMQVGSMLIEFVHNVVQGLLQMSCTLCMSVLSHDHLGSNILLYLHLMRSFQWTELSHASILFYS